MLGRATLSSQSKTRFLGKLELGISGHMPLPSGETRILAGWQIGTRYWAPCPHLGNYISEQVETRYKVAYVPSGTSNFWAYWDQLLGVTPSVFWEI